MNLNQRLVPVYQHFLDCSKFKLKEHHKAIINQIYKIAYPEAPYNFEHRHFNELKQQLTKLFQDVTQNK